MSYHDDHECPECGYEECEEGCINYVYTMTMSEAIRHSRFSGNCYCLIALREVNITDLEDFRSRKRKPDANSAKILNDRDRVKRFQKERSHIYSRPKD